MTNMTRFEINFIYVVCPCRRLYSFAIALSFVMARWSPCLLLRYWNLYLKSSPYSFLLHSASAASSFLRSARRARQTAVYDILLPSFANFSQNSFGVVLR